MKELSKTVEGRSIKDGAQLHPHLIKPSALPLKEYVINITFLISIISRCGPNQTKIHICFLTIGRLKLSPNESTAFQDTFGNHVYWLQLIKRPRLVGNSNITIIFYKNSNRRSNTWTSNCRNQFNK